MDSIKRDALTVVKELKSYHSQRFQPFLFIPSAINFETHSIQATERALGALSVQTTLNNPMCSHHFRNSEVPLYYVTGIGNIAHVSERLIQAMVRQSVLPRHSSASKSLGLFFFEGKLLKKGQNPLHID